MSALFNLLGDYAPELIECGICFLCSQGKRHKRGPSEAVLGTMDTKEPLYQVHHKCRNLKLDHLRTQPTWHSPHRHSSARHLHQFLTICQNQFNSLVYFFNKGRKRYRCLASYKNQSRLVPDATHRTQAAASLPCTRHPLPAMCPWMLRHLAFSQIPGL